MSKDAIHKTARFMVFFAWIFFLILAFMFFYYMNHQPQNAYQILEGKLILKADARGHYFVPGKINGFDVQFMVDTGASSVAVPKQLADKIGLIGRHPVRINTASGQAKGELARADTLQFGTFQLSNVGAVIIPRQGSNVVLLGMNVLKNFHMVHKNKQLIIEP